MAWEMILSIPGSFTDPHNWIIQSCMRAWEFVESKKHAPRTKTSGATDANILRRRGDTHRTSRYAPSKKRQRDSAQPIFSMETSNIAGHETTDEVFGVRSPRHLYARASKKFSNRWRRSGHEKLFSNDRKRQDEAWNLALPTQSIRTARGRSRTSPWPRYDEAALGFRNYWYPAMMSHKLARSPGGNTDLG